MTPLLCMAHYEIALGVVGHCLYAFEHFGSHGPDMSIISRPSGASLYVDLRKDGASIGNATGFVVTRGGTSYLVTNRHVVRGKGELPESIVIVHNRQGPAGFYELREEPLYSPESVPLWLEHPLHSNMIDVAALPLTDTTNVQLLTYDPWNEDEPAIAIGVSRPVNIIGFPFGTTGGAGFGVWVRGFVASEPELDWNGLPRFLVDSRTRQGQSGSPVIAYSPGGVVELEGGILAGFSGPVERFVGIYSGRINAESDLGTVWKKAVIREVIDGSQRAVL